VTIKLTTEPKEQLDIAESAPEITPETASTSVPQAGNSYSQIVKSSSIIGGSQAINLLIGLVRTKLIAILIGPSGIGLMAIYQSIIGLASVIAGIGINTSGVREVALYHGNGDAVGVGKTVRILQRVSWFTGIAGMLLLAVLAPWISELSFGSRDYAWPIAILGMTIFLGNVSAGQVAVIQGTRRIGDIARISIWTALLGALFSIGFCFWLGIEGLVPSLVSLALATVCISTWFGRKVPIENVSVTWAETWNGFWSLIQFGIALVISGLMVTGVAYATRLMIQSSYGLSGVGIYSAAFALSGMFVNFVIGAMGSDFLPRLSAAANDNRRLSQLINEQTEIGLLLAFPGLLATLVLTPLVVQVFYTSDFSDATILLKWFVLGCIGRVVSWPMGYSMQAKKQSWLFVSTEIVFNLLHLFLVWVGIRSFGVSGPGIAFALIYVLYTLTLWVLTRYTLDFRPSKEVVRLLSLVVLSSTSLFGLSLLLTERSFLILGCVFVLAVSVWCLKQIVLRLGIEQRLPEVLSVLISRVPLGGLLVTKKNESK
jgi:antigen flippase